MILSSAKNISSFGEKLNSTRLKHHQISFNGSQ
jgi:hypothetical protein